MQTLLTLLVPWYFFQNKNFNLTYYIDDDLFLNIVN